MKKVLNRNSFRVLGFVMVVLIFIIFLFSGEGSWSFKYFFDMVKR